jgi:2-desacetyl-2-hydroxyethyl bacteriochlorophyllide A dehydrogenase
VVYRGPGQVAVEELQPPRLLGPRDAIVRVSSAGICGTDLHPYRGELPDFAPGTVLGHEFAGTVHEAGPAVPFAVGSRVFASDIVACGRCWACGRGWHYQCTQVDLFGYADVVGAGVPGGQAEYVRVPFADVVLAATPDDISDEQAMFVGDALTTGYAAAQAAAVTPGDVVAVVGAGPVGLLAALCARVSGAGRVLLADPTPSRRVLAEEFGLQTVAPQRLNAALSQLTGGRGADAVIEAVGSPEALMLALQAAGPRAGVAVVGAHHSTAAPFPAGLAFSRELTVRFVVGDPITLREPVLRLIRTGLIDPAKLITYRLPLAQAPTAYRLFDHQKALKVVLTLDCAGGTSV